MDDPDGNIGYAEKTTGLDLETRLENMHLP